MQSAFGSQVFVAPSQASTPVHALPSPRKPAPQRQRKLPGVLIHSALTSQSLSARSAHSSASSHVVPSPLKPLRHSQVASIPDPLHAALGSQTAPPQLAAALGRFTFD